MTVNKGPGRFDIGRVLQNTASVLHHNFAPFLAASAIAVGPGALVLVLAPQWMASGAAASPGILQAFALIGVVLAALLLYLVGSVLLQAAVIHGAVADLNRRRATFAEMVGAALRRPLPLIGFSLLFSLALGSGLVVVMLLSGLIGRAAGDPGVSMMVIGLGVLAWAIPALLMSLAWAVGAPALVVEGLGPVRAFGRSAALTRGHRLQIFFLMIIWFVIYLVLSFALGMVSLLFLFALGPGEIGRGLVQAISSVLTAMVSAAGIAAIYYELRTIKEGIGPETMASIFD